ncbi:hypothetical protein VP01_2436g2 [Puccinia sorghi]|uniref:Uncharacterized protein n=1 Tax=Puccinia sorghi TaxID=27349 RepID=A0A0L6V703_9BASI|nr:hypothetical protein VP01_2436g2 [Puccinia sorghi]
MHTIDCSFLLPILYWDRDALAFMSYISISFFFLFLYHRNQVLLLVPSYPSEAPYRSEQPSRPEVTKFSHCGARACGPPWRWQLFRALTSNFSLTSHRFFLFPLFIAVNHDCHSKFGHENSQTSNTAKKNLINYMQLTCNMLQPSFYSNSTSWLNHFWSMVGGTTEASWDFLHVNCRQHKIIINFHINIVCREPPILITINKVLCLMILCLNFEYHHYIGESTISYFLNKNKSYMLRQATGCSLPSCAKGFPLGKRELGFLTSLGIAAKFGKLCQMRISSLPVCGRNFKKPLSLDTTTALLALFHNIPGCKTTCLNRMSSFPNVLFFIKKFDVDISDNKHLCGLESSIYTGLKKLPCLILRVTCMVEKCMKERIVMVKVESVDC